jgi:hypothetical protein
MRQSLAVDLFSKILIVGNDNSVFLHSPLHDLIIIHASCFRINGEDIMLLSIKPTCHGWTRTLIDKKAHPDLLQAKRHEVCTLQ